MPAIFCMKSYKNHNNWFLAAVLIAGLLPHASAQENGPAPARPDPVAAVPAGGSAAAATPQVAVLPGDAGSTTDKHAFGVLPNYRTVEGGIPYVPLTTKQKYIIATRDTLDGPSYALAAAFSSLAQVTNSNPSFGQGFVGYLHRYGTALADQDLGNYMTEAIVPSVLHEDPRYFRKGTGSKKSRMFYAATRVFVAHDDSGRLCFNTPEILGNSIAAAIGNVYYPDSRGFSYTMERAAQQVGTDAVSQILKEFWPDVKSWYHNRKEKQQAAALRSAN